MSNIECWKSSTVTTVKQLKEWLKDVPDNAIIYHEGDIVPYELSVCMYYIPDEQVEAAAFNLSVKK
jgi:hypothetical protein